jgi:hypothetical protein
MHFLSLQALIKPSKTIYIINLIALCVLLTPMYSLANDHFSSWSDKTICRLAKATPDNTEYQTELTSRGLSCGGGAVTSSSTAKIQSSTTKGKVAMKPDSGDWLEQSIYPFRLKTEMLSRVQANSGFAMADFDGDGIDDVFHLGMPAVSGLIYGGDNPEITNSSACDPNSGHPCFHSKPWVAVFSMKNDVTYRIWDGKKQDWVIKTGPSATEVSELVIDNNPIELKGQEANGIRTADFNGDGVPDIFVNDVSMQIKVIGQTQAVRPGKNDLYFLSQPDGTWLESTATHVTGTGVQRGKGLIKFTHGASLGDIDGDGDIDIVVTSTDWVGNNGEILCYVNQGNGHMKVRRCGNQFGFEVELGDIDNDGDLDIVFGGSSHGNAKEWNETQYLPGCNRSRCNGAYNGILLNDGKGNFNRRGFDFGELVDSSNGLTYATVPAISVADLDGDGDLDVVRSHVGRLYHGGALTIEENIGNGQFRTIMLDEMCDGPKKKSDWALHEGNAGAGCFISAFKFGDFNKDGLVDIVVGGSELLKYNMGHSQRVVDGTVYLSTEKLTYDTIYPDDANYPLVDFGAVVGSVPKENESQQDIEDELAAFEAELAAELAEQ